MGESQQRWNRNVFDNQQPLKRRRFSDRWKARLERERAFRTIPTRIETPGSAAAGFIFPGTGIVKTSSCCWLNFPARGGWNCHRDRETLSQQFRTVALVMPPAEALSLGYCLRYCFANCSSDDRLVAFRSARELVKRLAVNNDVHVRASPALGGTEGSIGEIHGQWIFRGALSKWEIKLLHGEQNIARLSSDVREREFLR